MKIITLSKKNDIYQYEKMIRDLFAVCFFRKLTLALWRWYYIDNPCGDPIVSLCFDDGKLVGHYAIIPLPLSNADKKINSYLSMTTMIAPSHQRKGLFKQLARLTYDYANESGAEFVIGFPNEKSHPGLISVGWDFPIIDYVASVTKEKLVNSHYGNLIFDANLINLPIDDMVVLNWRLAKPATKYMIHDDLIYKKYKNSIDLVYIKNKDSLKKLPDKIMVNQLISGHEDIFKSSKLFNYQFGGIGLQSIFDANAISRQMLISDIF